MADPARKYDEVPETGPRAADPLSPVPPLSSDPVSDPRYNAANDPRVANATVVQPRSGSNGVLIAALVVILAAVAYFIFAPSAPTPPATSEQPAATAPATPATPAPATPATPAPDATAPAAPAPAEPAPAPTGQAPAENAPATPAPAPAPAQ